MLGAVGQELGAKVRTLQLGTWGSYSSHLSPVLWGGSKVTYPPHPMALLPEKGVKGQCGACAEEPARTPGRGPEEERPVPWCGAPMRTGEPTQASVCTHVEACPLLIENRAVPLRSTCPLCDSSHGV